MNRLRQIPILLVLLTVPLALGLAACGEDDEPAVSVSTTPPPPDATGGTTGEEAGTTGKGKARRRSGGSRQKQTFTRVQGRAKGSKPTGISPDAPAYIGLFTADATAADARDLDAESGTAVGRWTLILGKTSYNLSAPRSSLSGTLRVSGADTSGQMTFRQLEGCGQPAARNVKPPRPTRQQRSRRGNRRGTPRSRRGGRGAPRRVIPRPGQRLRQARPRGPAGVYRWRLEGKSLTFRAERDPCTSRRAALTRLDWGQRQ